MYSSYGINWNEEADVVVVGYGGAGAVTAVTAHDAGARVLVLEKQEQDTPTKIRHTPNTRMSGGGWFWPTNAEKAVTYLEEMARVANEALDPDRREVIAAFSRYAVENTPWLKRLGLKVTSGESLIRLAPGIAGLDTEVKTGGGHSTDPLLARMLGGSGSATDIEGLFHADFALPGSDGARISIPAGEGIRDVQALFRPLSEAVKSRGIDVMWATPAVHLVTERGEVRGVIASRQGKEIAIRATRGIVLTCGGFEHNDWLKENYLRVSPAYFTGNPGNTGDGINMALEAGAALWHMNYCSWRVVMKVPGFPVALNVRRAETASIFVDRRGRRFTNERFKTYGLGYELTNYDSYTMCYPKVPCYWIFDEKRMALGSLARTDSPFYEAISDIRYMWSNDNHSEIDRGLIIRASTLDELASKIRKDTDHGTLMTSSALQATVRQYNDFCRNGVDADFQKPAQYLQALEDPPYYAVKLWPGGPNTQGGPRRNARGQVVRPDGSPIPRLYCAGELGSIWGMLYQMGGNIAELVAFGRICGENAASEKRWE